MWEEQVKEENLRGHSNPTHQIYSLLSPSCFNKQVSFKHLRRGWGGGGAWWLGGQRRGLRFEPRQRRGSVSVFKTTASGTREFASCGRRKGFKHLPHHLITGGNTPSEEKEPSLLLRTHDNNLQCSKSQLLPPFSLFQMQLYLLEPIRKKRQLQNDHLSLVSFNFQLFNS